MNQPERPAALEVLPDNIPAELKALPIWACWRYEWEVRRRKWTKVPYTPGTTKKASSTRPSSWRSFQAAYACYLERHDFFDGIFLCLQKSDPYAGGDFDHTVETNRIPNTYAELSPSGNGIRFIGRGVLESACKKPQGELYDQKRFLSITGHKLPSAPYTINPIQSELDPLYEELKTIHTPRPGHLGAGNRADNARSIPEADWIEARHLMRTQLTRLLARLRGSAISRKTGKDDTQLGCLLRFAYKEFAERWPGANILRSDDSIDSSQIRAIMASSIRMRGFTFPQYAALMGFFYGQECLEKWGTKERFQEELATLWLLARTPRQSDVRGAPITRPTSHQELLDRCYEVLLTYKAGVQAVANLEDVAQDLGVRKETVSRLLTELQSAGRIKHSQLKQYAGILIEFSGLIIDENKDSDLQHSNGLEPHSTNGAIIAESFARELNAGLIVNKEQDSDIPFPDDVNDRIPFSDISADNLADEIISGLIHDEETGEDFGALESAEINAVSPIDNRETPPSLNNKLDSIHCVSSRLTINPEKQVTLREAVRAAFDECRLDPQTGEKLKVTRKRLLEVLGDNLPWSEAAIDYAIGQERTRRRCADIVADMQGQKPATLRAQLRLMERLADKSREQGTLLYKYAEWAARELRKELTARPPEPSRQPRKPTEALPDLRAAGEQYRNELLDLVDKARESRGPPRPTPRAVGRDTATAAGLIGRLKARQGQS